MSICGICKCLLNIFYWHQITEVFAVTYPNNMVVKIIGFARSVFSGSGGHRDILYDEEAAGIRIIMETYAGTEDERLAVGNWFVGYSAIKGKPTEQEKIRARQEVDDVAKGRYDWRIDRGGNGLSV
jgi:hypothetical protein|nr:MAG TPA: hypothetical protein [Caudoviricetes sp.]